MGKHYLNMLFWLILAYLKLKLFAKEIIFLELICLNGFPFFAKFAASILIVLYCCFIVIIGSFCYK